MEQSLRCSNGVMLYCQPNSALHSIALSIYLRCGSMYETPETNGITHFYEHILFRNLNWQMDGKLYTRMDEYGIEANASTYKEFMSFDMLFGPSAFPFVLQIVDGLFMPIYLSAAQIDLERAIIKSEMNEDAERNTTSWHSNRLIWQDTPLALTVSGTATTINRVNSKKLNRLQQELLYSNNVFYCLTGSYTASMQSDLKKRIEHQPIKPTAQPWQNEVPVPESFAHRDCRMFYKNSCNSNIQLAFDYYTDQSSIAHRELLYDLLFVGESCLWEQVLRENLGLIYSFDPTLEEYSNLGNLHVFMEYPQANVQRLLTSVVDLLNQVKKTDFSLDICKAMRRRQLEKVKDQVGLVAWDIGYEAHIRSGKTIDLDELEAAYQTATPQQIAALAADLFRTDRLTVAVRCDAQKWSEQLLLDILKKLDNE